eukprot:9437414-Ditylum_brightwellii.AAC.1
MERKKQNSSGECQDHEVPNVTKSKSVLRVDDSVDVAVEVGGDGGVDGGESHLKHLTQEVDCCLMERKKQNSSGKCQDREVLSAIKSRSVLYDSAKSNDGKEVDET